MAVRRTVARCPADTEVQEGCGIPWGATMVPFAAVDENGRVPEHGEHGQLLPRCESCWAYLNCLCDVDRWAWTCNLNAFADDMSGRYQTSQAPELSSSFIDLELDEESPTTDEEEFQARPVFIAAVDLSASEEFLELVKSSLLAALEAIGPGSLFGLVTFSHKIGLYDVQGPIPVVKHVIIPADMDGRLPVDLDMVMPLPAFLAPVESNKEHIAAALETLKPTSSWERATAAGQGVEGVSMGGRGFGVAMDALIKYLEVEHGVTFAMARVFTFLSGPPDYGAGHLDTKRYGEQYASKGEDADKALLPEQTSFYKDLVGDHLPEPIAQQHGLCAGQTQRKSVACSDA